MNALAALSLFEAALARDPAAREAFIRVEAGDDDALRDAALALLAAHASSEGFLEPGPRFVPRDLGPYRLVAPLGEGGMGRVYLAERRDGAFEQRVAIKVLAATLGDADAVRRAEAERQFLAWLEHRNIARVLDGGTTPEGQPYVVMEYVDGERIDDWCRGRALDIKARIGVFRQVLGAVDAAHRALIIHRDIKPANVLVTVDGSAKLLDFGIAKSLDGRVRSAATQAGAGPLTPDYASPEQLAGQPLTTACDVYALGLLLHELLTGRPAFERGRRSLVEYAQFVATHAPTKPSARVDADRLGLAPRAENAWRRRLGGDLDRIVLKALQPEPAQRYASARAFADDLERWLGNRPVLARPAGLAYRAAKFVRRNRLAVAASTAAVLALATGSGVAAMQAHLAREEADRAHRANRFLLSMIERADPYVSGRNPTLAEALDRAAADIPAQFADQPALEADVRHAIGRAYLSLERLDEAESHLDRAAVLREPAGGTAFAETLDAQAMLDWSRGRYERAEERIRRAIAIAAAVDGGRNQAHAVALNDAAALLNNLGRYAEARPLLEQAIAIGAALPGLAPRELAITRSNLAYALHGLGELAAADAAYVRALDELERAMSPHHPDIAITLNNRAAVLTDMGRDADALALLERSIAIRDALFGPDHPLVVISRSNIALTYAKTGHAQQAREAIATALEHAPRAFESGNQAIGHVHFTAARVAEALGDPATGLREARAALAVYDRLDAVEAGRRERTEALVASLQAKLGASTESPEP